MARRVEKTVKLSDESGVKEIVVETVFNLWNAVNNLTRLRLTRQERYRVTIFGSARAQPGSVAYEQVKQIAKALAEMGCDVVTGGGPGLMQAANAGAAEGGAPERGRSVGIRVELPFEQEVNPFVSEGYIHETFFTRLHHFMLASDAFVVVPGGVGTTLEALMVWQLLQVEHLSNTPLIFAGKMWKGLLQWARTSFLSPEIPLASAKDLDIPYCVETPEEVIALLREHQMRWKGKGT